MGEIPEEAIRMRAYHIWEREGRPHGRDLEHWVQARIELDAEVIRIQPAPTAVSAARPQARANGSKAPAQKPSKSAAARPARAKR